MTALLLFCAIIVGTGVPQEPPGPHGSWTTQSGRHVWDGRKWRKPAPSGRVHYPARPLGSKGLWCDGVAYDDPVSRLIQKLERHAYYASRNERNGDLKEQSIE
jgi:hypothetical protein